MSKHRGFALEPIGSRFGEWTVVAHLGTNRHNMRLALVMCSCGQRAEVIMANLRAGRSTKCRECGNSNTKGKRNNCKLSVETCRELKARMIAGEGRQSLVDHYGISHNALYDIQCGRTWGDVEWPEGTREGYRHRFNHKPVPIGSHFGPYAVRREIARRQYPSGKVRQFEVECTTCGALKNMDINGLKNAQRCHACSRSRALEAKRAKIDAQIAELRP